MHELSIAIALVEQLKSAAQKEKAKRVLSAIVRVGDLSGVDPEALDFAFKTAAEETVADRAKLIVERVKVKTRCKACGKSLPSRRSVITCPKCGSSDIEIVEGRDLTLKGMEIETE